MSFSFEIEIMWLCDLTFSLKESLKIAYVFSEKEGFWKVSMTCRKKLL